MDFSEEDYNNDKKKIIKLKLLLKIIGDKDPYKLENDYFKKFECNSELDKIILVSNYLNHSLMNYSPSDDVIKNEVEESLNTISSIIMLLESNMELSNEVIRLMKRTLLKIAITFDINVMFLSETEYLYNDIKEKYSEKTRGLTR